MAVGISASLFADRKLPIGSSTADVDGRIILRWIFRKLEWVGGSGWSWLRIGTGGGHLWVR